MYRTLTIKNFRGIRHLHIGDCARINLLTGLNDAGKTSVLEALFLHSSGPLAASNAMQVLRPARGQDVSLSATPGDSSVWDGFFRRMDTSTPIEFHATMDGDKSYDLHMTGRDSSTSQAFLSGGAGGGTSSPPAITTLQVSERRNGGKWVDYRQSVAVSMAQSAGRPDFGSISVDVKLDPPVGAPYMLANILMGALTPDLADEYSKLRRRANAPNVLAAMRTVDDRIEGLEVLVAEGRPQLHADIGEGVLLPVPLLGHGALTMAKYVLAMMNARGGLLLIDEVGAGLHYSIQTQLWKVLHEAASRLNVQIFATTHSDETLRGARGALADDGQDLRIFRLKRRNAGSETAVSTYANNKLDTALDMNVELR